MKINVSEISRVDGASMNISFEEPILDVIEPQDGFTFEKPVSFNGKITNISRILKLDGILKFYYTANCSRCLKPITGEGEIHITEDFMEGESNENIDVYSFQGYYIELDKALFDNIILSLPVKLLCSDDCKGICLMCGKDLNEGQCNCEHIEINPKLEVLKNFYNN
jgi:Predicted metal-binding, possibly nucleic acid-binding protein